MKTTRLPETASSEELARFWDTHDLTDFEDQLEEVAEPVFRYGREGVSVPLARDEIEAAARIASSRGSDLAGLLHDWTVAPLDAALRSPPPHAAQ